eukprot:TRINITY_DN865_c0_g2_i15.p1 TRINITY_DN865_c0_g2~~TRINITY_DN865_c0_g2_i15.p1  ORF type:complete len:114 (-),score=3.61 TRINITY_DN865_c0_g2_i15:278-619(-)
MRSMSVKSWFLSLVVLWLLSFTTRLHWKRRNTTVHSYKSDSNDGNPSFEVCHFEGSFLDVPVPRVLQYICQYILTYGIYVDNLFQRSIDENRFVVLILLSYTLDLQRSKTVFH